MFAAVGVAAGAAGAAGAIPGACGAGLAGGLGKYSGPGWPHALISNVAALARAVKTPRRIEVLRALEDFTIRIILLKADLGV